MVTLRVDGRLDDPGHRRALRAAMAEGGGLRSDFQPVVDLATGTVVAYEALARGPEGPLARPDALFAAARGAEMLAELDQACRAAAFRGAVAASLFDPLLLLVNVEPEVVNATPLDALMAVAEQAPGKLRVVLEITERALTARPAELLQAVRRVRQLGWRVALDDVGADPASLTFLSVLQPDAVKLDLAVVQQRPSPAVAEVMHAVNAYTERTGALVIAEGIENEQHLAAALAFGATLGQGWHSGVPTPTPTPTPTPARGPLSVTLPPEPLDVAGPPASPFAALPPTTALRRSTKALLVEMSLHLERQAASLGGLCLVASTFQEADNFTGSTARRYAELADLTGFVCVFGRELSSEPAPGVRSGALDPVDPVYGEWDVVVLSPHFSAALLARDLRTAGSDEADREFEYALTYERGTVVRAAQTLLLRVDPVPVLRLR